MKRRLIYEFVIAILTIMLFNSCNVYNRTNKIIDDERIENSNMCEIHDIKMRKRIAIAFYGIVCDLGYRDSKIEYKKSPNAYVKNHVGLIPYGKKYHFVIDYVCKKCRKIRKEGERKDRKNWKRNEKKRSPTPAIKHCWGSGWSK